MSELLKGIEQAQAPTPRDSALGVILRRRSDGWHVLLAKRSTPSRFMPGHLAFPGGNLDPEDRPDEPGALARCVAREVAEETGLEMGWVSYHAMRCGDSDLMNEMQTTVDQLDESSDFQASMRDAFYEGVETAKARDVEYTEEFCAELTRHIEAAQNN